MPWKETCPMDQRTKFIGVVKTGTMSMSEACESFGISRKTGYKWLERYELSGIAGLEERSRAPKVCSWALSRSMEKRLIEAREKRPRWGPKKLLAWIKEREPWLELPAASTVGELLKRKGMVRSRRRTPRRQATPSNLREALAPNDCWCVDYKGDFVVGHRRCYPLTATDAFSRFLLACDALESTSTEGARPIFERLFQEYGLPSAIRSDNGTPFASTGLGGLSKLSVWWLRLGIRLERIPPGQPQHNGRHERMHRTLKAETAQPPEVSFDAQQRRFDEFRIDFNSERPHEALGNKVPVSVYQPSQKDLPTMMPELEYPANHLLARIRSSGNLRWRHQNLHVSDALAGEIVGLEQTDDETWRLFFGPSMLAIVDGRGPEMKLLPAK
jgi:putative transposase